MKKLALATSLVAAMAAISGAQAASTGTITFNGELTATTCNVNVDGQGNDATIALPRAGINDLTTEGQTRSRTSFNMLLSECEGTLLTAAAYFEAGPTVDTAGRLNNELTGTDAATEVQFQLRDGSGDNEVIKVGDASQGVNTTFVDISTGTATLPYMVEYYATGRTTAGLVSSKVVYSIQYD
ncbi:fimbrial protein [Buttiauxella gaviniae]|uniref:fimbrial protein n=1 Tax=Buttiauxella gaviniae TaxID=82990 RepID=UPI003BB4CBE1